MAFEKGDIIWVDLENRHPSRLKHPAVVWEDTDDEFDFLWYHAHSRYSKQAIC